MMRAHRRNGVGGYVPCGAGSAEACPYGAGLHMEFKDGVALMQYNTIEATGHDGDELRELYPDMFDSPYFRNPLEWILNGYGTSVELFDDCVEAIVAGDYMRSERDAVASMDWSDPEAMFSDIIGDVQNRAIRAYAAGCGVDAPEDVPMEMIGEDILDAYEEMGIGYKVRESIDRLNERGESKVVTVVGRAIAADPTLAREVALAIGRAHGELLPPEDAELPASSVRAFDARVRREALEQCSIAANRYADTLRSIADGLESAMKRCRGTAVHPKARHAGDVRSPRIKPWSEATEERNGIKQTIRDLRGAADEVQGIAGMNMGDVRNAEHAVITMKGAVKLARTANKWRRRIGDCGGDDEAFRAAVSQALSAYDILGSAIRRTQGLRGYYAEPVPGTAPITTVKEDAFLDALSKLPQLDHGPSYGSPDAKGTEAGAFLRDYGLTALRPDGSIETDPLTARRRSITRRLTTTKYETMLSRTAPHVDRETIRNDGKTVSLPCEACTLSERLSWIPSLSTDLGLESLGEEEREAAYMRGIILQVITYSLS